MLLPPLALLMFVVASLLLSEEGGATYCTESGIVLKDERDWCKEDCRCRRSARDGSWILNCPKHDEECPPFTKETVLNWGRRSGKGRSSRSARYGEFGVFQKYINQRYKSSITPCRWIPRQTRNCRAP
ncbi:Hypothetical protein NTJ_02050 [Nesidiocoris tenuis]|uniref:Secreted protein n=1 Tax=Nesidiocoris tenuis TaxID=355587 RepID=A0ABN7AAB1_9HEMI|nr:Hypothetical protein NTJ_02050 [Nesidiocoris tenuis]